MQVDIANLQRKVLKFSNDDDNLAEISPSPQNEVTESIVLATNKILQEKREEKIMQDSHEGLLTVRNSSSVHFPSIKNMMNL